MTSILFLFLLLLLNGNKNNSPIHTGAGTTRTTARTTITGFVLPHIGIVSSYKVEHENANENINGVHEAEPSWAKQCNVEKDYKQGQHQFILDEWIERVKQELPVLDARM